MCLKRGTRQIMRITRSKSYIALCLSVQAVVGIGMNRAVLIGEGKDIVIAIVDPGFDRHGILDIR